MYIFFVGIYIGSKDSEIGELYELVCREHGQELVDKLIADGKATAIEVGNAVFVKIRKLEWSENVNVNRNVAIGGVSQGPKALGDNVDLDSIASMFDDIITNTSFTNLDIGDGRLMRVQQGTRGMLHMHQQSHTCVIHGIPAISDGTAIFLNNQTK